MITPMQLPWNVLERIDSCHPWTQEWVARTITWGNQGRPWHMPRHSSTGQRGWNHQSPVIPTNWQEAYWSWGRPYRATSDLPRILRSSVMTPFHKALKSTTTFEPALRGLFHWPTVEDDQDLALARSPRLTCWPLPWEKFSSMQHLPDQPSDCLPGLEESAGEPPGTITLPTPLMEVVEAAEIVEAAEVVEGGRKCRSKGKRERYGCGDPGLDTDPPFQGISPCGTCPPQSR